MNGGDAVIEMSSVNWLILFGIDVWVDIKKPAGWDVDNLADSFKEKITFDEFCSRLSDSELLFGGIRPEVVKFVKKIKTNKNKKMSGEDWFYLFNFDSSFIEKPVGWSEISFKMSLKEKITFDEFYDRLSKSTLYDGMLPFHLIQFIEITGKLRGYQGGVS